MACYVYLGDNADKPFKLEGCKPPVNCAACRGRCKQTEICVNGDTCECVTGFNRSPSGICEPPPKTCQKICKAYGDPHFLSFDGLSFSFHGSCTYILAEYNEPGSTCRFRISLRSVRVTQSVPVTFSTVLMFESLTPGQTFSTRFNRVSKELTINNVLSSSPYVGLPGDYQVGYESGVFFVRSAQCSIDVTFQTYTVTIQLGKTTTNTYAGNLIGLCGNCDGDKTNDLDNCSQGTRRIGSIGRTTLRDSCLASDAELAYRPSCVKSPPPVTCETSVLDAFGSDEQKCGLLMPTTTGPFAECLASGVVDVAPFFESCKKDACYTQADINEQQEIICASLSTFEVKCREAGFTTDVWRSATFCPPPVCPQNSHYNHSAVTPRPTCTQPFQYHAANAVKLPLCICDDGYMLSGQICVLKSKCDVCVQSQCKNGGICEPQDSGYRCICLKDFTGDYCENGPGNLCDPNPCNGGVCQIDPYGEVVCLCPESLTGDRCTMPVPVDPCSSNPCENGLCQILMVNGVPNNYTCSCDPDYTGNHCQCGPNTPYDISTNACNLCFPNPCGTNGQCVQSGAGYTCNCNAGFTGNRCQCSPSETYVANNDTCVITGCQPACSDRQSCINNICQCKTGLVTSGTTCSCPSVNLYWDTTTLTCQPACQGRCKDREICVNGDTCECVTGFNRSPSGICEPPTTTCQKICKAYGDPHFLSFDGLSYNFHGLCTYTLAEYNEPASTCRFRISLRSVRLRPSVPVTFSTVLMFESLTPGQTFSTRFNRVSKELTINNVLSSSPYVGLPGDYQVGYELGRFFVRSDQCSIDVTFEEYTVTIKLGKTTTNTYAGNLIGLCGNCNGDKTDDLDNCTNGTSRIDAVGRPTVQETLHHCLVNDTELSYRPSCDKPPPSVTCETSVLDAFGSDEQKCGLLTSTPGPFTECIASGVVDVTPFFESCIADACYTQADINEQQEIICASLSTFEVKCREAGFTTDVWRSATFCPPPVCPQNSHYNHSAVTPRPTCTQPFQYHAANAVKLPLCICDDGYMLSGQICVLKSKCDVCVQSQCKNGGICEPQDSGYRCICLKDFTGDYCENGPGNLCDPNPCNGGVCQIDPYGEVVCLCPESLTGDRCTMPVPVDPCSSNPCKNGLCQILLVNGVPNNYTCSCDPDYTGNQCQCGPNENYDANTQACKLVCNGCTDRQVLDASGICQCVSGTTWNGSQCACDSNRLWDTVTKQCIGIGSLTGTCGMHGNNPCSPGECVPDGGKYYCVCPNGHTVTGCQ
ncbi:IgGFc-binding protein-like [Tubulanus polymorphus]|uniref:IgGFc-binding protein-like n=1 Tax=Tubulanus polymorphus TaxID=672921 RepID=UPI003DA42493